MTLQNDLEILTGESDRAKAIHRALLAKGKSRRKAYEHIVKIARHAGLGIVRMTTLLIKYEDDRRQRVEASGQDDDKTADETWAAREFFKTVSSYGDQYQVRTRNDLVLLVSELTLLRLKHLPTDSTALSFVEEQRRVTVEQLAGADTKTAEKFRKLKNLWLCHNVKLKSSETTHDELVEQTASTRRTFMKIFGKEFLAEREQYFRMDVADRRLQLMKKNPGINEVDIERMLGKGKEPSGSHLSRHQLGLPIGCLMPLPQNRTPAEDGHRKAKSLWRNLAMLTHPDKIRQRDLSWSQRRQLELIWHEMLPLRAQSNNKGVLAQSVIYLDRKLQLAEQILKLAHLENLDAALIVQGTNLGEQILWLESANDFLDEQIRITQADNLQYSCSQQIYDMQALVEAPKEAQEVERQAMMEKSEAYRKRAEVLEHEASRFTAACA
jgi:hypothetical protein